MKHFALILCFFLFWMPNSFGESLSNGQRLKKMSFLLRSIPPSADEYAELDQLPSEQLNAFFQKKTSEYLTHENFSETFHDHALNLFRMHVSAPSDYIDTAYRASNAFDNLIRKVFVNNEPWKNLLLTQDYELGLESGFLSGSDLTFFQFVFYSELKDLVQQLTEMDQSSILAGGSEENIETIEVKVSDSQQKKVLAGVVTTNRFFMRYQTTKINKNRRRAAALFRIFLCDNMKPVVLTSDEEDKELLNKSLLAKVHIGGSEQVQDLEAKHGSDPQCMSCHYKLDPMAHVFRGSGVVLNKLSSWGGLVFKNNEGQMIEEEAEGFHQLAEKIIQQRDYKSCQVQHFWNWVIGEDVPLNDKLKTELINKFEEVEEKPKDFIAELIELKEFSHFEPLKEKEILFSHVKPILQRCDSCHVEEPLAPTLGEKYPYPNTWEILNGISLVEAIISQTDLVNLGQGAKMPPKNANWKLSRKEADLLLAWVKHGAKDDQGKVHYSEGKYFKAVQNAHYAEGFNDKWEPTFFPSFRRILSKEALPESLIQIFPGLVGFSQCRIDQGDRNILGYSNAETGLPVYSYFNPNYLFWWLDCLDRIQISVEDHYRQNFSMLVNGSPKLKNLTHQSLWAELDSEKRTLIFGIVQDHVLGVGALEEIQKTELLNLALAQIEKNTEVLTVGESMKSIALVLLSSEAYLTY